MIKIYDKFLPEDQSGLIEKYMSGYDVPWTYSSGCDYPDQGDLFQFVHAFPGYTNQSLGVLDFLINKLREVESKKFSIMRIKANLNPKTNEHIQLGEYHVDFDNVRTAIFYINTNNGYTLFESGDRVDSVSNRIVLFDSNTKHVGYSCTDEKIRLVVNINYYYV
tara:strand:- start:135 stop:626 length:492 start_codon:yes stop_codon:yes gene_type:complete